MRKWRCVLMIPLCLLLTGCGAGQEQAESETAREAYQTMTGCVMEANVTGGVGEADAVSFSLRCEYVPEGESTVEILAPESVAGIRAVIGGNAMSVVYEDLCLPAGTLGTERISPAACLPRLMDALREGWLMEESAEDIGNVPCLRLCLDESSGEKQLAATLWLRKDGAGPLRGEIAAEGKIILTAEFTSFQFCDTIKQSTGEQDTGAGA